MPIVNYIREHETFIEYASNEGLSGAERLVWTGLFHIFNGRARGANWPDGFIKIPNERLLTFVPLGFDAMARARNRLMERGLISYVKGSRNSAIPMYRMHFLTVPNEEAPQTGDWFEDRFAQHSAAFPESSEFYPEKTDNSVDRHRSCPQVTLQNADKDMGCPQVALQNADKTADILRKLNVDHTYTDDEEEGEARAPAISYSYSNNKNSAEPVCSSDVRDPQEELAARVAEDIRSRFGYRGTLEECRRIAALADRYHVEPDLVDESIRLAAENHARSIFAYLVRVYEEWFAADVRTLNEYGEYLFTKDVLRGRMWGDAGTDYRAVLEQGRLERRKKHQAEDGICEPEGNPAGSTLWQKPFTQKGEIGEDSMDPGRTAFKHRDDGETLPRIREDRTGRSASSGLYGGDGQAEKTQGKERMDDWSCGDRTRSAPCSREETAQREEEPRSRMNACEDSSPALGRFGQGDQVRSSGRTGGEFGMRSASGRSGGCFEDAAWNLGEEMPCRGGGAGLPPDCRGVRGGSTTGCIAPLADWELDFL